MAFSESQLRHSHGPLQKPQPTEGVVLQLLMAAPKLETKFVSQWFSRLALLPDLELPKEELSQLGDFLLDCVSYENVRSPLRHADLTKLCLRLGRVRDSLASSSDTENAKSSLEDLQALFEDKHGNGSFIDRVAEEVGELIAIGKRIVRFDSLDQLSETLWNSADKQKLKGALSGLVSNKSLGKMEVNWQTLHKHLCSLNQIDVQNLPPDHSNDFSDLVNTLREASNSCAGLKKALQSAGS